MVQNTPAESDTPSGNHDDHDSIIVILDRPAHGGNIGATARAMRNMGFTQLRLVNPRQFPHEDVENFGVGARQVIDGIRVFDTLDEALADLNFLVATTNRSRGQRQTVYSPEGLGEKMPEILARPGTRVGLLFGTESSGLETRDVERCDVLCNIPTAGEHGSLNLSQAVLIILYALMREAGRGEDFAFVPGEQDVRASAVSMERFFEHLEETLTEIEFLKHQRNRHMMGSLRAIFHRACLDQREVSILRGILSEVVGSRERGSGG
ncbi:MAG: RNA methyltransferase [Magnetococcales bacterium]|nr:RNA methyltransferase [Magnetococcales bacterium]